MSARNMAAMVAALDQVAPRAEPEAPATAQSRRAGNSREGLKHIGGYLVPATVEKMALLRIRLQMDNSEVLTRAIDALYAQETARRSFGG